MTRSESHSDTSAHAMGTASNQQGSRPRPKILAAGLFVMATACLLGGWFFWSAHENHQELFQKGLTAAAADPTKGEQYLRAAIACAEDHVYPDAEIVLCRLLIQRGDRQGARSSFDHIDLTACRPDLALAFARVALQADLTELAEQALEALASREIPEREAALEMLCDHYQEWGQDEQWVRTAQRLAHVAPTNPRHWTTLVELLARMSRHSECAAVAREALAADLPDEVKQDLRNVLIEAFINLGDVAGIELELTELRRVEGDSLRVRGAQVYLHRLRGESIQSLELIGKIMDGETDSTFRNSSPDIQAHAYFTRGILLFDLRRFDEAARDLERVVKLQPANSAAKFKLSEAYRALQRDADSTRQRMEAAAIVERRKKISDLQRRREATPRDPTLYRQLAELHQASGDAAGAARWRAWAERVKKSP